jgi:hypothetical protein
MALGVNRDAALSFMLVSLALLRLRSLAGILSCYLGLMPVSIIGIGVGLPPLLAEAST